MNNEELLRAAFLNVLERLVVSREKLQEVVAESRLDATNLSMQNVGQFESFVKQTVYPLLSDWEQRRVQNLMERFKQTGPISLIK